VVVHRHTHELTSHDQPPGKVEVIPARLETPRGVIVEEEHAARPVEQRQSKEFSPVDRCLGAGTEGELADGQETVAPIQAHESEDLAALPLQPADKELSCDMWLIESFGSLHFSFCKPLSELNRRQKGSHLGRSESWTCRQLAEIEASDPGETSGVREQAVGFGDCVTAPSSGPEQHGQ